MHQCMPTYLKHKPLSIWDNQLDYTATQQNHRAIIPNEEEKDAKQYIYYNYWRYQKEKQQVKIVK